MDLTALLLTDYNVYRVQTAHIHELAKETSYVKRWLKPRPENLAVLDEMVRWCRDRRVEPRLWLYFLFRLRQWRFAPRLKRSDLCSEKALARYQPQERLAFFRAHTARHALVQDEAWDPNRDLTSSVEAQKLRYQESGQHMQCRNEQLMTTLGYHPKSPVCGRCPVAAECAVELESAVPFSLLAVRNSRMTAAQAEHVARRGGHW